MTRKMFLIAAAVLLVTLEALGGTTVLRATRLQTRFTGLSAPIFLTHAGDGSKRTFIVERAGIIKVVQPGSNVPTNFLNITALTTLEGERGLLGLAFHPQYETNRRFFVYYTKTDGDLQISEFEASPANPNVALTSEKPILTIEHSQNSNHNGGTIAFGPDGYLYAATGDGGAGNDPPNNAQNINVLLGKVLRIDVNVPVGQGPPYAIPPTNPFAGATAGADEIFALGLRNPFRWSFDRETGQMWVGDVGQNSWEEVDLITNGGNYGWRIFEGNVCTGLGPDPCTPSNYVAPLFVYSSENTTSRCSITGGYVYRGTQGTLPDGSYIFGDYCTGEILLWHGGQQVPLHDIVDFNLVSFGEDEDGELYVIQTIAGVIQKIVPAKANADFDGDFRTDFTVYRPGDGNWYSLSSTFQRIPLPVWGEPGDVPVPGRYQGSFSTRVAVFRVANGLGYWIEHVPFRTTQFGQAGDIPVPRDFDGDGWDDLAVFRPSTGVWMIRRSSDNAIATFSWGVQGDIPVPSDFDGDGKADVAVWRPSDGRWYVIFSTNNSIQVNEYGVAGDIPARGDFDNDGRTDLAVFRPSTGQWFQKLSRNNNFAVTNWGQAGDVPVVGDYDADGRDDIALWRPSSGTWFIIRSSGGIQQVAGWGVPGDIPVPNRDAP